MTRPRTMGRAILGLDLALVVATVVMGLLGSPLDGSTIFLVLFATMALGLGAIGSLIVARQPRNAVGWIFLLSSAGVAVSSASFEYLAVSRDRFDLALPGTIVAAWLNTWVMVPTVIAMTLLVPLLFPTGRLPSPRWRPVGLLSIAVMVGTAAGAATVPGPLPTVGVDNPFGIAIPDPVAAIAGLASVIAGLVVFALTVAALAWRYRHGTQIERLQLRWFAYPAALAVTGIGLSAVDDTGPIGSIGWMVGLVSVAALPFAVGIAILRHRLFDIDRIVSRTVAYTIVTGLLGATFVALVITLETLLAPLESGNNLAVAGSTLVAFALFQPMRSRVQRAVDRRFDRARYDGERLLAALGERLRDEVDLGTIRAEVLATVDAAVRPSGAGLWLRGGPGAGA